MGIKILDGQVLHPVKHFPAHLAKKPLRDIRHQLGIDRNADNGKHVKPGKQEYFRQNFRLCPHPVVARRPLGNNRQHLLQKDVRQCRGNGGNDDAHRRHRHQHRVRLKQHFQQSFQHLAVHFRFRTVLAAVAAHRSSHFSVIRHRAHLRSPRRCCRSAVRTPRGRSGWISAVPHACPSRRLRRCSSPESDLRPVRKKCAGR